MHHQKKDALILDFFSGSATTAHAVMQLNAEDGGKRNFIMVQLPEIIEEGNSSYNAGYTNICEIGKERIRKSGKRVNEEMGFLSEDLDNLLFHVMFDLGVLLSSKIEEKSIAGKRVFNVADGELDEDSTCKEFLQVQTEGTRQIKRNKNHYNFRMILAIGYRVRSNVGIHFRNLASGILEEYTRKGFAMGKRFFFDSVHLASAIRRKIFEKELSVKL